jgi:G3E family GTPase
MTRLYLITGFLGAGKTTFLKKFAPAAGGKIAIIVNEFGRENIDEKLLRDANARLHGVAGGSILCACRLDQFEAALAQALSENPDAILVETSGLSDPSAMRDVLRLRAEFSRIDYRGCVCLADARNLHKVYETARVIRKQLDAADLVVLTKLDAAAPEEAERAKVLIARHAPEAVIMEVSFGELSPEQAQRLKDMRAGARKGFLTSDVGQHCLTLRIDESAHRTSFRIFEGALRGRLPRQGFVKLRHGALLVTASGAMWAVPLDRGADNLLSVLYAYGQQAKKTVEKAGLQWVHVVESR